MSLLYFTLGGSTIPLINIYRTKKVHPMAAGWLLGIWVSYFVSLFG